MGSTLMSCAVDQKSGVHGTLIPMSMPSWVGMSITESRIESNPNPK